MVSRAPRALQIALLGLAASLLGVGVWLRLLTAPWHTNLWTIDWLSYYEPQAAALAGGRLHAWIGSWEGLHPPLSGVMHGAIMVLGGGLGAHWVATVTVGLLAVGCLWRLFPGVGPADAGLFALLVGWVALSPLQANYGLNPSPYPWVLLLVGAATAALVHATDGPSLEPSSPRRWLAAGVLMGLAVQTHVLAFAIAFGHALWLGVQGRAFRTEHRAGLLRWGAAVALLSLPMIVGSLTRTADPWTFHIEPGETSWWSTVTMVVFERFGDRPSGTALAATLGVGALGGLVLAPRGVAGLLLISVLGWLAALVLFFQVSVADPRLSHYYLVPHLLALALGAAGWREVIWLGGAEPGHRVARWILAGLALVSVWWGVEAVGWQVDRRAQADALVHDAAPAPEVVRGLFTAAGQGDVVAYLWDHQFLNDEPEYLDPVAARWPVSRLGRRCPEEHPPRGLCNALGSARFYFDPSAFADPLWELEEPLRMMVNRAEPPGAARIVLLEGPDRPPHPWPAETWMATQGGVRRQLAPGVVLWEFAAGARIDPPVRPLRPPDDPSDPSDVAP